jgi:hypothetical protein
VGCLVFGSEALCWVTGVLKCIRGDGREEKERMTGSIRYDARRCDTI